MNMENLTPKFSHQTRLTNSRGFYLRVTEDNVEGVEDENDKYSECNEILYSAIFIRRRYLSSSHQNWLHCETNGHIEIP